MSQTGTHPDLKGQSAHFYQHTGWRFLSYALWIGLLVVLLGSVLASTLLVDAFWIPANVRTLVQTWLVPALLIPPMVLIVAAGGLDLSVGAVAALMGVVMALLLAGEHANVPVALAAGLLVALTAGVLNALLVGVARLPGALVTLAMAALLRGIVMTVTEGRPVVVRDADLLSHVPVLAGVLLVLLSIATILFVELAPAGRRRYLGTHETRSWLWRAVLSGLPYVLSALMAGLVGAWYLGRLGAGMPSVGSGLETDVLLAVFLGGTPWAGGLVNLVGAVLAGLVLALGRNLAMLGGAPVVAVEIAKGAALLVSAALSQGYFAAAGWLFARRAGASAEPSGSEELPQAAYSAG